MCSSHLPQGLPGTTGLNGTNGINGFNGANGVNGVDGLKGDTGPQGVPGLAPPGVITNNQNNVTLSGNFKGNGNELSITAVNNLQDSILIRDIDYHYIHGYPSTLIPTNVIFDSTTDSNGVNNSFFYRTAGSYCNHQFYAQNYGFQDLALSTNSWSGGVNGYPLVLKSFTPNTFVFTAYGEFSFSSCGTASYEAGITYGYANGSWYTNLFQLRPNSWTGLNAVNPFPELNVTNISYFIYAYAGSTLSVRSATVTMPGNASIQSGIKIPWGCSNIVFHTYGNRESGDNITYQLSWDIGSLTNLKPDILYQWTNIPPQIIQIFLKPAPAASVLGTSISTYIIKYNVY